MRPCSTYERVILVHVTQKFAGTSRGSVDNIAGDWPALPTQQTVLPLYVHRVRVTARIRFLPRLASIFDRKFRHEGMKSSPGFRVVRDYPWLRCLYGREFEMV